MDMRQRTFWALAILCLGISGCATPGDWWPFGRRGTNNAGEGVGVHAAPAAPAAASRPQRLPANIVGSPGDTYKGVKEDWGMQSANMQPPKDLEDTSSTFGW